MIALRTLITPRLGATAKSSSLEGKAKVKVIAKIRIKKVLLKPNLLVLLPTIT